MTKLTKSNFNEKIAVILQEQRTKQCQTRKLKSIQDFSKKEQWFKANSTSSSKPQHGVARDPNKQKMDTQYQTYYWNDCNQDKNNRRSNYRYNTGHGGEKQRYNRNLGQLQKRHNLSNGKHESSK